MLTIDDFQQALAHASSRDQFAPTGTGGVTIKSVPDRLKTWLTSSTESEDSQIMKEFRSAMETKYGKDIADVAWESSGLSSREDDGRPLSVRKAMAAMREADKLAHQSQLILDQNTLYQDLYQSREKEARNWDPSPQVSQVDGPGLRLARIDEGEFRMHNWTAKNNSDAPPERELELDALVKQEVEAIKTSREKALEQGKNVPEMSERLMYLQAKLNLTERMVSEAAKPENLKKGGPGANIFLGPDMFFSPSDGPVIDGVKTYGGACTEEEMKQINEGLRKISEKYPQLTLMPGTVVWSKPSETVPIINGLPHPCDTVHNTGGIFSEGNLAHLVYKKTDGGDANWSAMGVNGVDGKCFTQPTQDNGFTARLQVFPNNSVLAEQVGGNAKERLQPVLDEIDTMSDPFSKSREWEDGLREDSGLERSPHNNCFILHDKPMVMEICRDHTDGVAQKYYGTLTDKNDPFTKLAREQPGLSGGAQLHVVLSASNMMAKNKTVLCEGGVGAQNDVSGGVSKTLQITKHVDQYNMNSTKPKDVSYRRYNAEIQKTLLKTGDDAPTVKVKSKVSDKLQNDDETPSTSLSIKGKEKVERSPLTKQPHVRDLLKGSGVTKSELREMDKNSVRSKISKNPGDESSSSKTTKLHV